MRTTLDIDDDVVVAARRGLTPARVEAAGGLPAIRVPGGTAAITPEMVRRALDEH